MGCLWISGGVLREREVQLRIWMLAFLLSWRIQGTISTIRSSVCGESEIFGSVAIRFYVDLFPAVFVV